MLAPPSTSRPVILDHDGGIDDYVAMAILATGNHARQLSGNEALKTIAPLRLIGSCVVDADCFVQPAVEATERFLALASGYNPDLVKVPVGGSSFKNVADPFPDEWRKDSIIMRDMPALHSGFVKKQMTARLEEHKVANAQYTPASDRKVGSLRSESELAGVEGQTRSGEQLLLDLVVNSPDPVTVVVTGPMSNVAWCVKHAELGAKFVANIEQIVVMGGALDVGGNVFLEGRDKSAEWNFFWDAPAVAAVLRCKALDGKVVFFTLDSTNHVPFKSSYTTLFGSNPVQTVDGPVPSPNTAAASNISQFIGSIMAAATFYNYIFPPESGYFAWDALTAAYVVDPSLVTTRTVRVGCVETSKAPDEGKIFKVDDDVADSEWIRVVVADKVDVARFEKLVLDGCSAF